MTSHSISGAQTCSALPLEGKVALVTGASRGIGRAIALRLAREGADVIVNYLTRAGAAREVVTAIRDSGRRATSFRADVGEYGSVVRMIEEALRHFGHVDVLVNNALSYRAGKIHKIVPGDWEVVVRTGLIGAYYCSRLVIPGMLDQGWGRIVNIGSFVGLRGWPGDTAYASAKAGIIGFTKALALEVAGRGITVNAVVPGFVKTDMTAGLSQKSLESMMERIPMGRPGHAEEIAEVVCFLASRGTYITGAAYAVDGGIGI